MILFVNCSTNFNLSHNIWRLKMTKNTSFFHHNRAQISGFVSPMQAVERSIPHFTRGGNTPIAPPAVLNPGGLANAGLWRLKSATWDAPHFRRLEAHRYFTSMLDYKCAQIYNGNKMG